MTDATVTLELGGVALEVDGRDVETVLDLACDELQKRSGWNVAKCGVRALQDPAGSWCDDATDAEWAPHSAPAAAAAARSSSPASIPPRR